MSEQWKDAALAELDRARSRLREVEAERDELKSALEDAEQVVNERRKALEPFADVWDRMVEFDVMFTPLPNQHHYRRAWLVLKGERARGVLRKGDTGAG